MKPRNISWREYLLYGVTLMEGTVADPHLAGRRRLPEAYRVFNECSDQRRDRAVRTEAFLRRAQCAYYQGDLKEALGWLGLAEWNSGLELTPEHLAQCYLLTGIVFQDQRDYAEALTAFTKADTHCPASRLKLKGDILNRLGCLFGEYGDEFLAGDRDPNVEACTCFNRAVAAFLALSEKDDLAWQALAAASGRAGVALQRRDGYAAEEALAHFRRAEELFATQVREPCVPAAYWYNRASMAWYYWRPQALWFWLRSLWPSLACLWQKRRTSKNVRAGLS